MARSMWHIPWQSPSRWSIRWSMPISMMALARAIVLHLRPAAGFRSNSDARRSTGRTEPDMISSPDYVQIRLPRQANSSTPLTFGGKHRETPPHRVRRPILPTPGILVPKVTLESLTTPPWAMTSRKIAPGSSSVVND
ncbi:hypothetical protein BC834DRAFT_40486 [Gloeopeniophorella convolvens]|nr:hypothetical protein BC834DRAFT_40486 [Gloeopeniophorella convolvens]